MQRLEIFSLTDSGFDVKILNGIICKDKFVSRNEKAKMQKAFIF
jgi:hypothetical protein